MAILNLHEKSGPQQLASAPGSPESKAAAHKLIHEYCGRLAFRKGKMVLVIPTVDPDLGMPTVISAGQLESILSTLGLSGIRIISQLDPG